MRTYPYFLRLFIALLAGSVLPLAFAPLNLWPFAILSPAVLVGLWQPATLTPKKALVLGWFYGLGLFGVGVSWVYVSIHEFGNTNIPLGILITSIFVAVLAGFPALQGYCLKRFFKGSRFAFLLLGFPSTWVLFEWIRGWFLTGFPWLYLGYTELNTALAGYAPILSVFGVSLAVAFTSGALVVLWMGKRKEKILACALVIFVWGVGQLLRMPDYTHIDPKLYTVSLVQGNVKPLDKFSQMDPIGATEKVYGTLSKAHWKQDLILWPESAIPLPLPSAEPYIKRLAALATKNNTTLITGIQVINQNQEYHNSLIALGNGKGLYHKYHLVPFGDFLPFENWLRGLIGFFDLPMSSFKSGPRQQALITAGDLQLDPLICYEIAFPELVRETLREANAIITLSEDGWFGGSWGPHQHLQIAQMRALETGRYVLRATTCGITAIINPKGQVTASLPQFEAAVLSGTFQSATGNTPWVNLGLWPLILLLLGCSFLPRRFKT